FLAGPALDQPVKPVRVEAELYRAYPIENYDTASLRITTAEGISMLVLMTHVCERSIDPIITLHGSAGRCRIEAGGRWEIQAQGETTPNRLAGNRRDDMPGKIARWMLGEPIDGPVATLEIARAHSLIVNGASDAAGIAPIPPELVREVA